MSIRRNRPRLMHFAGLLLVGNLATLAFGVLLSTVTFFAVEPVQGRQDFTMRATRPGASDVTPAFNRRASRGQIESPPRRNWVFDQKAARRLCQFCKGEPVAGAAHAASYAVGVEIESVGKVTNSWSSAPMTLAASLPPSNTTAFSTSSATTRSTPFAAETRPSAGAAARYYDVDPLTWVLVVLLLLIVAFICWPPPPGDVDTGPGCNG
jgi:hypothetical protein